MNDNDIIKALKCCKAVGGTCEGCAFGGSRVCIGNLHEKALDLINSLQKKIEFLQSYKNLHEAEFNSLKAELELSKAFYKEKQAEFDLLNCKYNILVKEMMGDAE